jgi:very-short-patch-repair endonuclease
MRCTIRRNRPQTDLIDELLAHEEKSNETFRAFRARWDEPGPNGEREPFDVKNLENVQGDERDVVIISVTYGRDPTGNFYQRFGPINTEGGERRMNVLFTRARERVEVFCSFDPGDIQVSGSSKPGLRAFRGYLQYASGESWAEGLVTGKAPDSDFEVAVAHALSRRGYEVKAQIGVSGYFIDLAVVDPERPDRFLLGIECDGATYHSAKSARDRDRLRQEHLERLGWRLERIWSTAWFRNPEAEVDRIAKRLEGARH